MMDEVTDICKELINLKFLNTEGSCDFTASNSAVILECCSQMKTLLFNSFHYSGRYQAWIDLVNTKYLNVAFHHTAYQQVTRFEKLLACQNNIIMPL